MKIEGYIIQGKLNGLNCYYSKTRQDFVKSIYDLNISDIFTNDISANNFNCSNIFKPKVLKIKIEMKN